MSRRRATITQADVARAIRAAKREGAAEVEVHVNDKAKIVIRLADGPSLADANPWDEALGIEQ